MAGQADAGDETSVMEPGMAMRVAFGNSGWAALVVLGSRGGEIKVIDRCRLESVGPPWGKDQKDAALAAMVALHARAA